MQLCSFGLAFLLICFLSSLAHGLWVTLEDPATEGRQTACGLMRKSLLCRCEQDIAHFPKFSVMIHAISAAFLTGHSKMGHAQPLLSIREHRDRSTTSNYPYYKANASREPLLPLLRSSTSDLFFCYCSACTCPSKYQPCSANRKGRVKSISSRQNLATSVLAMSPQWKQHLRPMDNIYFGYYMTKCLRVSA